LFLLLIANKTIYNILLEKWEEGMKELFIFIDDSFALRVIRIRWNVLMIIDFLNNFIDKIGD
jgi:hypothetical protein